MHLMHGIEAETSSPWTERVIQLFHLNYKCIKGFSVINVLKQSCQIYMKISKYFFYFWYVWHIQTLPLIFLYHKTKANYNNLKSHFCLSNYSSWISIHFCMCLNQLSKHFWKEEVTLLHPVWFLKLTPSICHSIARCVHWSRCKLLCVAHVWKL